MLSVGGYAAGPISVAARMAGIPLAILEPNNALGLTNRLLAPLAHRVYTAFPEVERAFRPSVVLRAGVPLRRAFERAPFAPRPGRTSVLVLGGSLGAAALNDAVPRAIAALPRELGVSVIHQTGRDAGGASGPARDATVRALYSELGVERATVVPFIDDVAAALAAADLVIARSGASATAELCAIGRASILIPFPFAVDDHQLKNARSLEAAGAAVALPQAEAAPPRIAAEIEKLARDPARLADMAAAAASLGRPDADARIAVDLLELAQKKRRAA